MTEHDGSSTKPIPAVPGAITPDAAPAPLDVYATLVHIALEEQRAHASAKGVTRAARMSMAQIRVLGAAAVEPLIRASRHRDEAVKLRAFRLLSSIEDARVSDRMLEALGAEEPLLALYAVQKLSRDEDKRAVAPLRKYVRWLERLVAIPALPFSQQYAANSLNGYFLKEAREVLERLNHLP
jgi:HEAT repeat protein